MLPEESVPCLLVQEDRARFGLSFALFFSFLCSALLRCLLVRQTNKPAADGQTDGGCTERARDVIKRNQGKESNKIEKSMNELE